MADNIFYFINVFISFYGIAIAIFGTIGNFISLFVCLRPKLISSPTFVFISFMLVADSVSLYFWNLSDFFLTFYGAAIADLNLASCRWSTFLQLFSSQSSAFLQVSMTIERFISSKSTKWRNLYFTSKYATILCSLIVITMFCINFHLAFRLDYVVRSNTTLQGACTRTDLYVIWREIHFYLYSLVPFIILLVFNACLIFHLLSVKKNDIIKDVDPVYTLRKQMSKSVIVFTISFILLTAPYAFAGAYFLQTLLATQLGRAILYSLVSIAFTYHASNFIILFTCSEQFNKEFKKLIQKLRRKTKIVPEIVG